MKGLYTIWFVSVFFLACTKAQPVLDFTPVTLSGPALVQPVDITGAGDGSGRLFIVEKRGTIRIIQNNVVQSGFFLDIQNEVMNSGERGLLGLAFHPQYPDSPYVFVNYVINQTITTRISRFTLNPNNANDLLESSELILIEQTGIQSNHKAGDLTFGPDGFLYIGFGDGGGGYDPGNNGQNLNTLLAKIIRIDIDHKNPPKNYSIPPDNPFVNQDGLDEIWYYGMRNPWRISFDRYSGDFWIGDVGQDAWEEVDFIPAGTSGGLDFGWDCYEGNQHPLETGNCSGNPVITWPIFEYPHNCNPCPNGHGACLTGGFVYRGSASPYLYGYYICADYVSNFFWLIKETSFNPPTFTAYPYDGTGTINAIETFGEDDNGELYAANLLGDLYYLSSNEILPVNWEEIHAIHIAKGNRVTWTLHQTSGIKQFEIERSFTPDFADYQTVATVKPVVEQIHYSYDDLFLQTAGVYYRIVAIFEDGSKNYSPITRILPDALSSPALIYDPGMNLWRISLPINWRNGQLVVYDLQGKEVFSKKLSKDKMVELTPPIVPGCYFIQVKAEHDTWSDKIVW